MKQDTIFDQIVRGEMSCRKVWEDEKHLAFLTPFPNTPGVTVVIPKTNVGDNIFSLTPEDYAELMLATKAVANLLEIKLNVSRVALVFEGTGVAYVHAKLFPMHGPLASVTGIWPDENEFVEEYRGYFTTLEGPPMDDERLDAIQKLLVS